LKGHIRGRSKGSWEIIIDIGRDPSTGRRRQHSETVRGKKSEAQRRLAELLVEIEKGSYVKTSRDLTLGEYLRDWHSSHAHLHCRPRTSEGYAYIIEHYICPRFGRIRLNDLRPMHVANYCAETVSQGRSARSALHDFRLLHKALRDAVRLGLLGVNPCDGVEPPRLENKEMHFLTPAEVGRFLEVAQKAPFPYYYLFRMMLYTGLRRGEALGLTWSNVDLELCTLSVTQALYRVKGTFITQPPKTKSGRRVISLSPSLALLLTDYRRQLEAQHLLCDRIMSDSEFCFAHPDGKPFDPPTVTHQFVKLARKAGLAARLHDLRHTYASIMLAAGVNIKAISQALGHANVSITLNVYSHLLPGAGKSAALKFERLFEPWLASDVGKMLASEDEIDTRLGGFEPTTLGSEDRCSIH
jgi:integrase